jgi:hypothetical protein
MDVSSPFPNKDLYPGASFMTFSPQIHFPRSIPDCSCFLSPHWRPGLAFSLLSIWHGETTGFSWEKNEPVWCLVGKWWQRKDQVTSVPLFALPVLPPSPKSWSQCHIPVNHLLFWVNQGKVMKELFKEAAGCLVPCPPRKSHRSLMDSSYHPEL